jgi:NitT/TauT family transport system permease protein
VIRKVALFLLALVLVAAAWELYKLIGPEGGGEVAGMRILPRANDTAMPHVWNMAKEFVETESSTSDRRIWQVVLDASWYSFRLAVAGFALGSAIGIGLATLMARFGIVRRGLLPYLVVSQTVPLIALAPLVVSWGGKLEVAGWEWPRWLSVTILGAFLAFFPVAVGALRGLESAPATALELMRSFAASSGQTMRALRFPSAVPFLVPALKLAAAGAVIGVVVAEISTAARNGIGRLILEYSRQSTANPAKVYPAIVGAAIVGLSMAGVVAIVDHVLMRNRPRAAEDRA